MPFETRPEKTTFEAVYNINSHAKKYARLASENYEKGKKATARANSLKKRALYSAKTKVLNQMLPFVEDIERHDIDGNEFLCLYFSDPDGETWSFHQPPKKVHRDWVPDGISLADEEATVLDEFDSDEEKERSDMSLKAALLHIESLGYNANDLLPETHVQYGHTSRFVGWTYLGDDE